MASSAPEDRNKPVTGHPTDEPHVATGYPWSAHPSSSDSYFYIPAPPSPHFPARPRPRHSDHPRPNSSLCICAYLLLVVLLTFGVFSSVYIILFVLRPLPPSFHVGSAYFPRIFIPLQNDVVWNLSMQVTNPNSKLAILYDSLETSVLYKGKYLTARTELSPIDQGHGNRTFWHARLQGVGVSDGIGAEEERDGVVSYGVRVLGTVRFRSCGGWRTSKRLMKVFCDGVEIGYDGLGGGVGSLLNPGKECSVEI